MHFNDMSLFECKATISTTNFHHGGPILQCERRVSIFAGVSWPVLRLLMCFSYIEGIVRGYRNSLLTSQNYGNLTQCETIDGGVFLHAHTV